MINPRHSADHDDVLVVQMGARRSYELAYMLERQGRLSALVTDYARLPERATWRDQAFALSGAREDVMKRRVVRGVPARKLCSSIAPNVVGRALRLMRLDQQLIYELEDFVLGRTCIKHLHRRSPRFVLSTAGNGGLAALRYAKQRGVVIAVDFVIDPGAVEAEQIERRRWPEWVGERGAEPRSVSRYMARIGELAQLADILLCANTAVANGLNQVPQAASKRVEIIPYPMGEMHPRAGDPEAGRILFIGSAILRKGLPYVASAFQSLRRRHPNVTLRVVGDIDSAVPKLPACEGIVFTGKLDRSGVEQELCSADVFCLPSLGEGTPRSALEAMSFGIPVVATEASGAPIRHDIHGKVVPPRDPGAIAAALEEIIMDRSLRQRMAQACLEAAMSLKLDDVGTRLASALSHSRD